MDNTTEPKYLTLDISTMGETLADGDVVAPIGLTILSEEENGVSWANDWYDSEFVTSDDRHGLEQLL
ncbi:MAG: hypothetical protein ACLURV_03685 [Gallintestinimicrobium sp.]